MHSRSVPNYWLYRAKTGESEDFWLHSETLPERSRLHDWEISLHRHEALFQLFVVKEGEGELLGPVGRVLAFKAPCAIYIAPGSVHGFRYSHDADGLVITVLADRLSSLGASDPSIAAYLAATRVTALEPDETDSARLAALASGIHEELHAARPGGEIILDAMVTEAMLRLARTGAKTDHRGDIPASRERDRQRTSALEALVAAHCREHRPVGFYARKLGLSAGHLNRLARRETGASVQELATRHLLRAARRDLVFTPTPVQAIAYSLGFQDPAYFNRFFKRRTGMTPGAFREAERGKLVG
ncbi:helix-turn-helix domain-containing protein [Chelativorans alearense]|uniref:helix-turn-helix domain-containing protein n=1 Tax=Chelativorans alearense TaxID=2681495 RepID=UPI0013D5FBFB|nr:helix-turn-helix domain-containing protein [Chelativorans alearense]